MLFFLLDLRFILKMSVIGLFKKLQTPSRERVHYKEIFNNKI